MPHACYLNKLVEYNKIDFSTEKPNKSRRFIKMTLVSEDNQFSTQYFRSEKEIKQEKIRQLKEGYWYIIHPFSKFMQIYDFWLLILYSLIVTVKPLDAGIRDVGSANCAAPNDFKYQDRDDLFELYVIISTSVDVLSWTDVIIQFFIGYYSKISNKVELNRRKIAFRYIFGPFFVIDVIGGIPRFSLRLFMDNPPLYILGIQNIFCLAKGIKFLLFLQTLSRVYVYTGIKNNTEAIAIYYFAIFAFTMHYVTTLNQSVGRIFRTYFGIGVCEVLIKEEQAPLSSEYSEWMFRTSAYFLQVSLPTDYYRNLYVDEGILLLLSYVLGKIFIIVMWTNVAISILTTRIVSIRFQRFMTQVEDYLQQKKVPIEVKNKIFSYYHYKYRGKYFKEEFLTFLMSNHLKQEIKMSICRPLIERVKILEDLSMDELTEFTRVLIPEIILSSETVFNMGDLGDCIYFIYSGTVAIYTFSGLELCHLQDGSYFGDVSLIRKSDNRLFTVIAVETCQLYKISKADLERIISIHSNIYEKMIKHAKSIVKAARELEQRNRMFIRGRYASTASNA